MAWILIAAQIAEAVFYVFKYGPQIMTMVQEIIAMLRKLRADRTEKEALAVEFKSAVAHYRTSGDKGPLRRLRDRLHARCYGESPS